MTTYAPPTYQPPLTEVYLPSGNVPNLWAAESGNVVGWDSHRLTWYRSATPSRQEWLYYRPGTESATATGWWYGEAFDRPERVAGTILPKRNYWTDDPELARLVRESRQVETPDRSLYWWLDLFVCGILGFIVMLFVSVTTAPVAAVVAVFVVIAGFGALLSWLHYSCPEAYATLLAVVAVAGFAMAADEVYKANKRN